MIARLVQQFLQVRHLRLQALQVPVILPLNVALEA